MDAIGLMKRNGWCWCYICIFI